MIGGSAPDSLNECFSIVVTIVSFEIGTFFPWPEGCVHCDSAGWPETRDCAESSFSPAAAPQGMRRAHFPGALAECTPGAGDGCPVWYVNSSVLGWSRET